MMAKEGCLHCQSLETEAGFLFSNECWRAFLVDEQDYLGRCIIELKEHKESLSELTNEDWYKFGEVVKTLEGAIKKAFGAEVFNWSCLMNNAYKEPNPLPHVHWHVRPRYRNVVEFAGVKFSDPDFGHHYDRERRGKVSDEVMAKIIYEIRSNL